MLFDYVGQLRSGAAFQGTLEADSQDAAERTLAEMGVRVTSLRPARRLAYVAPLSLDDYAFFNEQVAALTRTGLPLEAGLRQLAADVGSRKLKRLLLDVAGDLAGGATLDQAVERQRARFPGGYTGVVQAGLRTGTLEGTLASLAADLRLRGQVRRALIEAAAYPLTILAFTLLILSLLMRSVVPQIEEIYRDWIGDWGFSGVGSLRAPQATSFWLSEQLFAVAHAWPAIEPVLGGLLVLTVVVLLTSALPGMEAAREGLLRLIPGMSQIFRSGVLARFAHVAALTAQRGAPLPELLAASGQASGSPRLSRAAQRVAGRIEQGASLDDAVRGETQIPAMWTFVVNISGPRGELPSAMADLARVYETRAQQWISIVRALLTPILLLLVGSVLAGIMVAVVASLSWAIQGLSA